jgi:hypothetical protein
MRRRGDYGEVGEGARRFSVQVRCLECMQVVDAVPERDGHKMWQHKLPSGKDCPAWKLGTNHESVHAQAKRERLERERAARVPLPLAASTNVPSWQQPEAGDGVHRALDEYSGDYRDRRAGGSRC